MNASDKFRPVLRVAENREQTAAKQFGKSQQHRREQEEKLENLKQYHLEYLERFQQSASNGMSASQLREYQLFLNNLEQAIAEQEKLVSQSQADCSRQKDNWRQKHMRTQVMDKAMEKIVLKEQQHKDKIEQKAADEHSLRKTYKH
ncbi:MAG: flagellar export protein FliJ [Chromatiales bacterium]|jgi:flagellar FliJ protein